MDKFIVTAGGTIFIGFIYWFFFGKKEITPEVASEGGLTVLVDGGYKPARIKIPKGIATDITFIRNDDNSCLEEVIFPDFRIKQYLPLHKPVTVRIKPEKTGTFTFHCAMNMFKGTLLVE